MQSKNSITELKDFYESPLGKLVCRILRKKIGGFWGYPQKEKIAGFGFVLPYLPLLCESNSTIAYSPSTIGALSMNSPVFSVLCDENSLPAKNEYFDRLIVVHGAENSENIERLMEEFWRILRPGGRLLVITASEDSFWRNTDTPFAKGKGMSHFHLLESMIVSKFSPRGFDRALFFPPTRNNFWNLFLERLFSMTFRAASGVLIMEGEKVIFAPRGRTTRIAPSIFDKLFKPKTVSAT